MLLNNNTAIADIEKIPLTFTYVGFRADFLTWIYKKYRYKKRCRRIADIEKIPLLSHYLVTYYSYQPDLYNTSTTSHPPLTHALTDTTQSR